MTQKIFTELDHRLSVVPRWGILHTIQNQSVAEHVHNVVRITERIGVGWFGLDHQELLTAIMWAHHHDDEESLTGDLPTMVKPFFDEGAFIDAHRDLLTYTVLPPEKITDIVKLADKMEGLYFLAMEMQLGNKFAVNHYEEEFDIISKFASRFNAEQEMLVFDWLMSMRDPLRSTRYSRRGR